MDKWEDINQGDLVTISSSKRIYASDYVDKGVPFYRSKEIIEFYHGKDVSLELFISEKKYLGIKEKYGVPSTGDVLVTSVGTIGVPMLIKNDAPFYFKDGNLIWIKLSKSKNQINPKYFYFFLDSDYGKAKLDSILIGSSQKALTITGFNKLKIKLPPLGYQKKIASILSAYDDLIENNLKRIKLLEEKAQLTYEEWFVRMKYPGHENDVVDSETGLPEGWCKAGLEYLCEKITDGTHDSPKKTETGIYLITGKDLKNGFVDFSNASKINIEDHKAIKKRSGLNYGDILFSNIGTLGNLAYVFESFEYSCKNVIIFKRKQHFNHFLLAYLSNKYTKKKLEQRSSGVAQKFFSLSFVRNFKDVFPPKNLIEKYDKISCVIIKEKIKLMMINNKLISSRNILLPRLMSGMIDVNEIMYNYPKEILE